MSFFSILIKQAGLLLTVLLAFSYIVLAFEPERRALEPCPEDINPEWDGGTNDKSPGIGVELETQKIRFFTKSDKANTGALKGKRVGNRYGDNWELTADTTLNSDTQLDAEYILDGRKIKIGTGAAEKAANEVRQDIIAWNPSADADDTAIQIEGSDCDWRIKQPNDRGKALSLEWSPQITAPLPLEAINDLASKCFSGAPSALLPVQKGVSRKCNMIYVTQDFFQSSPNGISPESVKKDVLGFFTLVLSYAKRASPEFEDSSPKDLSLFMPRTDFTTIFNLVKSDIPGSLYGIIKILACYRNAGDGADIELDTSFCTGTVNDPKPNEKLDGMEFGITIGDEYTKCSVQEWIESIQNGEEPDQLTSLDTKVDGSIGGRGKTVEYVLGTTREIPLIEFRRLPRVTLDDIPSLVHDAEQEVLAYHHQYNQVSRLLRRGKNSGFYQRRDINNLQLRRRGASSACALPTSNGLNQTISISTTAAPSMPSCTLQNEDPDQGINNQGCICDSTTLPLLQVANATDASQSCSYTAMPSSNLSNPITIETAHYTSNCQACTMIGGIADIPSCTSVAGCTPTPTTTSSATPTLTTTSSTTPTFTVFLSNNSIPVGNADNSNGGSDLRSNVYNQIHALCPDSETECDSTTAAQVTDIPTVTDGNVNWETLLFTVQDSHYENTTVRDQMLAVAISMWQQAVAKSCQSVPYQSFTDELADCDTPPVKRHLPASKSLQKRAPTWGDPTSGGAEKSCSYTATICAGPDHINPVMANATDPYGNHMNIQLSEQVEIESDYDNFVCELVVDGLSALAMGVAPELAPAELFEDIDFQALCQ